LPFCQIVLTSRKPASVQYPKELTTLGDHLKKRRLDLRLTQREVARRLGTNKNTIRNWERNRGRPVLRFMPGILQFLGYVPACLEGKTLGERIVAARRVQGLSQRKLAAMLGIDPDTLAKWEREEREPGKGELDN